MSLANQKHVASAIHICLYLVVTTWLLVGCRPTAVDSTVELSTGALSNNGALEQSESAQPREVPLQQLVVGEPAPDFEVEVRGGGSIRFSQFVANNPGPTIVLFDRAHW